MVVDAHIDIMDSSFFANLGGEGGHGGFGGEGGHGGVGGESTKYYEDGDNQLVEIPMEQRGGFGGDGADGGDGGHGGGGAGGVSYGAYCYRGDITTDGVVRFSSGGAAFGGNSAGNPGEAGTEEDEYHCR